MGEVTGKGLDVKGKWAKAGILSGFVPFVQIHQEEDTSKIRWPPRDERIPVYCKSFPLRKKAEEQLLKIAYELKLAVDNAKAVLDDPQMEDCEEEREHVMEQLIWEVTDFSVYRLDDFVMKRRYGLGVAERILCETRLSSST